MTSQSRRLVSLALALMFSYPALAMAHPMDGVGDFYAGLLHPAISISSLLTLVAAGLLAGQQGRDAAVGILIGTPVLLASGALFGGAAAVVPPSVSWVSLLSMPLLGLFVAWARSLPVPVVAVVALLPVFAVGWANGIEMGKDVSRLRFVPGVATAGLVIVAYAVGTVRRFRTPWIVIAYRVAGSWIAAVGVLAASARP